MLNTAIEILKTSRCVNARSSGLTEQIEAYLLILQQENAEALFLRLFSSSETAAGKFYCLLGLHRLQSEIFPELIKNLPHSLLVDYLIGGSRVLDYPLYELIPKIEDGSFWKILNWPEGGAEG